MSLVKTETREIEASLIHAPQDLYRATFDRIKESKEKSRELTRRFLSARKIPFAFIKEDERGGGWFVRSSDWRNGPLYYHVYRTVFGVWLCSCEDFFMGDLQICKHILRTILWVKRGADEEGRRKRLLDRIQKIMTSETRLYFYKKLYSTDL